MATRAATFTAKIRNLKDYHSRTVNGLLPAASGADIANTLKYFSQTLLGVLKDVPYIPSDNCGGPRQRDNLRLSVFPNLNYSGLYQAVRNIIEIVRLVQSGQHALGESILAVIGCLVPFLETDVLHCLPYTVATTLAVFPPTLHKDVVELLCANLLPVTLNGDVIDADGLSYASESTAAILMLVFQYITNGEYHSMLIECLMSLKKNIAKDLLCVIAYGPPAACGPAVHHMFYYWPQLNPSLFDKTGRHHKFSGFAFTSWKSLLCQREACLNSGNVSAVKICLDPTVASECKDHPPPLYLCTDCASQLNTCRLVDVLQPVEAVSLICDNKNCQSVDNIAMCTCCSIDCASAGSFHPVRYCRTCHHVKHLGEQSCHDHVYHVTIPDIWSCDPEMQGYLVDAIVRLLKEAEPLEEKRNVEMGDERSRVAYSEDEIFGDGIEQDERKLLSRYGVWLLVELTPAREDVSINILGRLLAVLFKWYDATAYLPDDNIGNALNKLKAEYISKWLADICSMHFEVVVSCLLPHPPEYSQVGGYCDVLSSRTLQIKEGLNRILCLAPYGIVNFKAWDYIMAFWLEAIRSEIPRDELQELKVLMCKAFDIDMSPSSFGADHLYHFISERFEGTSAPVQEQCLEWLQILTKLETFVPVDLLLKMFHAGVTSLTQSKSSAANEEQKDVKVSDMNVTPEDDDVPNLKCFIMMLDVLLKQIEIQRMLAHAGLNDGNNRQIVSLLSLTVQTSWSGQHSCSDTSDCVIPSCTLCELSLLWYQLSTNVLQFVVPASESPVPVQDVPDVSQLEARAKSAKNAEGDKKKPEPERPATPDPEPEPHCMSSELQLLFFLLKCTSSVLDADTQYYWLSTLHLLCIHANCLQQTAPDEISFVQYCLKCLMVPSLWHLLQADNTHVASVAVPLLIHCLAQPSGANVFWELVENDFNSEDWKVRFAAVEKVTVLARLLTVDSIQNNQQIKTSLAHAACYLIGSLQDINLYVVERTALYLETIKASSIKCLLDCLEFQFDTVISDRSMIFHRMFLLSVALKHQEILTWEMFLNRFDTLCLEAQLDLENSSDISNLHDLHNSDHDSKSFLRKINYARFALARTDSIRSVSESLIAKPPYRRASSVPMQLFAHDSEKDKNPYTRQRSAPQFRSRGSRLGLSLFTNYIFPGGHLKEFTDGESNFTALLQRAMEMEGVDRETLHQLVFLLMKFMTQSEQDQLHHDVVLRHLSVLLGYNQTEKSFSVPPYKLRYSAVFNAYMFGLANVLDENYELGNIILPMSMILLQYCPSPQRYASDYQPPNYTVWLLEPMIRHCWLMALLVILYKYQYNVTPASGIVQTLVRIAVNTIDARKHECRKQDDTLVPSSPIIHRTRDTSTVSAVDLENIIETETPPQSPALMSSETRPLMSSDRRRCSIIVGVDGDDVVCDPKMSDRHHRAVDESAVTSHTSAEQVRSPVSSLPSSPRPDTSTAFSVCPLRLGKTFAFSSVDAEARSATMAAEAFIQRQQEQVGRIAEYSKRSSLIDEAQLAHVASKNQVVDEMDGTHEEISSDDNTALHHETSDQTYNGDAAQSVNSLTKYAPPAYDPSLHLSSSLGHLQLECVPEHLTELEEEVQLAASEVDVGDETSLPAVHKSHPADTDTVADTAAAASSDDGLKQLSTDESMSASVRDSADMSVHFESDVDSPSQSPKLDARIKPNYRQRKVRKTGLSTVELQKAMPELSDLMSAERSSLATRRTRRAELLNKSSQSATVKRPQTTNPCSAGGATDNLVIDRCPTCHVVLESYDDDTISLCIVCLATFIHREPALATPLLLDMLHAVSRVATYSPHPWQADLGSVIVPGNCVSVARQFLRCVLHQLAPNNVFPQIFMSCLGESDLLKMIATALTDFADLNCYAALQLLLEGVNDIKTMSNDELSNLLINLATYLDCIVLENSSPAWPAILTQFDIFFRRLLLMLSSNSFEMDSVLKMMIGVLKIPGLAASKGILDPFSKLLSYTVQNCMFHLQQLMDICSLSGRALTKERDKLFLPRCIVLELIQALKFKMTLPDENLLLLVQLVCVDAGGTLGPVNIVADLVSYQYNPYSQSLVSTNTAECMRHHLTECVEFIADLHTINKVKNNLKMGIAVQNLNEDTLGSHLKAGIAQFVALEFTRAAGRDNRILNRYLPWLYHPPSAMQQGPREFIDCVAHIRVLSWLLIGSLTHTAVTKAAAVTVCQPLDLTASSYIADHIMVILTGFAEQSKASVLHMSSLFHAFTLCQLWTMYCESLAALSFTDTESYVNAHQTIMDFWGRVTPGILQLLSHSKVLAEMVNLHFLSLMEALQECNSTVLTRLFSMWIPILYSYHSQLTGHMQVRLQMVQNWQPKDMHTASCQLDCDMLTKWLKRLQFKLSQIEVQSSAATQFYTV